MFYVSKTLTNGNAELTQIHFCPDLSMYGINLNTG
jgi:hypothetical protein